jgi:hypothetical protein
VSSPHRVGEAAESPTLTIFSAPKAFEGHVGVIQENAIRSWSCLSPKPKIILFGEEAGTADAARRHDVQFVTSVETNSYGTPLVSSMFSQADSLAAGEVLAFMSADIILTQSSIEAIGIAMQWSQRFLLVAQRHDVEIREPVDFDAGWENRWAADAIARGTLHSPGAIDWFVFRRGQYKDMPPFAIGRTAYDNWILWKTVASEIPLIDATAFVTLIHQDHDYVRAERLDVWDGEEARTNRSWIQHWTNYYTIAHANWKLAADGTIVRASDWKYRMARPRQLLSHALRASRPMRTRLRSWRLARRYRT